MTERDDSDRFVTFGLIQFILYRPELYPNKYIGLNNKGSLNPLNRESLYSSSVLKSLKIELVSKLFATTQYK